MKELNEDTKQYIAALQNDVETLTKTNESLWKQKKELEVKLQVAISKLAALQFAAGASAIQSAINLSTVGRN